MMDFLNASVRDGLLADGGTWTVPDSEQTPTPEQLAQPEEARYTVALPYAASLGSATVVNVIKTPGGLVPVRIIGSDEHTPIPVKEHPVPRTIGSVAVRSRGPSPREIEVHELLTQGLSTREIGELLRITQGTVNVHMAGLRDNGIDVPVPPRKRSRA